MAHDPEIAAKAVNDVLRGDTYDVVASRYGVGKGTIKRWMDKAQQTPTRRPAHEQKVPEALATCRDAAMRESQNRHIQFQDALEGFLLATVKMLNAWAKECSDPEFIRAKPGDVNELGKTVLQRADVLVAMVQPSTSAESKN